MRGRGRAPQQQPSLTHHSLEHVAGGSGPCEGPTEHPAYRRSARGPRQPGRVRLPRRPPPVLLRHRPLRGSPRAEGRTTLSFRHQVPQAPRRPAARRLGAHNPAHGCLVTSPIHTGTGLQVGALERLSLLGSSGCSWQRPPLPHKEPHPLSSLSSPEGRRPGCHPGTGLRPPRPQLPARLVLRCKDPEGLVGLAGVWPCDSEHPSTCPPGARMQTNAWCGRQGSAATRMKPDELNRALLSDCMWGAGACPCGLITTGSQAGCGDGPQHRRADGPRERVPWDTDQVSCRQMSALYLPPVQEPALPSLGHGPTAILCLSGAKGACQPKRHFHRPTGRWRRLPHNSRHTGKDILGFFFVLAPLLPSSLK